MTGIVHFRQLEAYNNVLSVEVQMDKLSRADMQIKIRTPIGLLLVLSFLGKWLLETFDEGRTILEHLPPVLAFLARPFPSIALLITGIGLILWELQGIRKTAQEPEKRRLRHYLIGSGLSFIGLVVIVAFVFGASVLFAKYEGRNSEFTKAASTPSAPAVPDGSAGTATPETKTPSVDTKKEAPRDVKPKESAKRVPPAQQAKPLTQSVQTTEKQPQFNFYVNHGSVEDSYFSGVAINVGDPNTQLDGTFWRHNFVNESSWFRHLETMKALEAADAVNPRFLGTPKKVFSILTPSEMMHLLIYLEIENKGQPSTISNWQAVFGSGPSAKTIKGTPVTKDSNIRDNSGKIVNSVLGKTDGTPEITSSAALAQSKTAHGWIDFYISDAALISDLKTKTVGMVISCQDNRGAGYIVAQGDHRPMTEEATELPK
jgi:hypothetical protein